MNDCTLSAVLSTDVWGKCLPQTYTNSWLHQTRARDGYFHTVFVHHCDCNVHWVQEERALKNCLQAKLLFEWEEFFSKAETKKILKHESFLYMGLNSYLNSLNKSLNKMFYINSLMKINCRCKFPTKSFLTIFQVQQACNTRAVVYRIASIKKLGFTITN